MTQDERDNPLNAEDNPEYARFLQVVDNIGARAPEELSPIAIRLDEAFPGLYPKSLKRIRIGPLVSPLLWDAEKLARAPLAKAFLPLFVEAGLTAHDFVLFFSTETVQSMHEQIPTGLHGVIGLAKTRQVFAVSKTDPEAIRRQATLYSDYCIVPHRLRQILTDKARSTLPRFANQNLRFLAYQPTEGGITHVG